MREENRENNHLIQGAWKKIFHGSVFHFILFSPCQTIGRFGDECCNVMFSNTIEYTTPENPCSITDGGL